MSPFADLAALHSFVLLTSFAPLWARGLPFVKAGGRKAVERSNAFAMTTAMVVIAYLADSTLSCASPFASTTRLSSLLTPPCRSAAGTSRSGYILLLLHILACGQRAEIFTAYNGDERQKARMHANGAVLATVVAGTAALLTSLFVRHLTGHLLTWPC